MKEAAKNILRKLGIYHKLQRTYRKLIGLAVRQYYRLSYATYKGSGYICNCCGARYSRFVANYPKGKAAIAIREHQVIAGYGDNVFCPNCMSKNRERLVIAFLKQRQALAGKKVLHFSPEKHVFRFLKEHAAVTTVDMTPGFYRHVDPAVLQADARSLDFPDESFDLIIANHILEHIPDDELAMKEMWRVLRRGGAAILQAPYSLSLAATIEDKAINDPRKQELLFGQKDHVRIYALADYVARLRRSGFDVEVLTEEHLAPFEQYAIQKGEYIFLAKRPL